MNGISQVNEGLTPEERAYLFHVVKKSPILNNNFGRYFDYQGPDIIYPNKKINYDSIELLIINQPEILIIRKEEIAKSSKGLIAEAANKMAIWELNKMLLAKRNSSKNLKQYKNEYKTFEMFLMQKLPPNAIKIKDLKGEPHPKVHNVMNPSLSFDEKTAMVGSFRFLDKNDQLVTLTAINYAINAYVLKRSKEIYHNLGGVANNFTNVLVAAGDGSSTSGVLEEREKDERGRWNKGLPKAVGLFPYQIKLESIEVKKKVTQTLEPMRFTENDFLTVGKNRFTNIHFDVWGYNSKKQTTVVIEKNGLSYHLFGSLDTRFLSPDSTFSDGKTFQAIINDLEFNKIAKLKEMIYGKKGYDHWIDYNKKKKDQTELKIEKKEKEYSDMGYSSITTSSKPSRKVKRSKRKAMKGKGPFIGKPTTESGKKQRKKLQNEIVHLYGLFDAYKKKIEDLEAEKEIAVEKMNAYQRKLDTFKEIMGRRWASFIESDGMYIFEDSSTFDIKTQEFQFQPTLEEEAFEIRLIAIPESSISKSADEVMLHINIMDAEPNYNARINLELNDVFASDKWDLPSPLFSDKDSVAIQVFFEGLLDKRTSFEMIFRGQGIGSWNGTHTIKEYKPNELKSYPGNASKTKMDSTFLRLRKSELMIHMDRDIVLEINSFTDPVVSNLKISSDDISSAMLKHNLSKNDILSAYRTLAIMDAMKVELNVLAGKYLSRENAMIVIDRFNREWSKTKISVGRTSFKHTVFN